MSRYVFGGVVGLIVGGLLGYLAGVGYVAWFAADKSFESIGTMALGLVFGATAGSVVGIVIARRNVRG